jgi:hypothetical protein
MEADKRKEDGPINKWLHNNSWGKGKCKWELHTQGK